MTKHTIKGFITYEKSRYTKTEEIGFSQYKPNPEHWPDRVVVREHSFEVEVPDDFDPRGPQIANLQEQKRKLRAAFALSVKEIDDRINSLLAIENMASA